jgi:tRNA nucleotidyltransferase (CCA-adding enzyme)
MLAKFIWEIIDLVEQKADEKVKQKIYLVGGAVRDFLIGEEIIDYDLLCEKSALALAEFLQTENYAQIVSIHEPFGTVKIQLNSPANIQLDLATTRTEIYEFSGALPIAQYPQNINIDLARRDFTINAIALELKPKKEFEIIDIFAGQADLKNKCIKVLHDLSYFEDPTRILRAIRFAVRFNYKISEIDLKLIAETLNKPQIQGLAEKIRGIRIGIELKRLLELNNYLGGACLMTELGAWTLLSKENLIINLNPTDLPLPSWQARLAYLLWNNHNLLNLLELLGFEKKIQKQIGFIQNIINQNALNQPSIKLIKEINNLDFDFYNLLFNLRPAWQNQFKLLEKALPQIKPLELIEQGFSGIEINQRLEYLFQENLLRLKQ